MNKNLQSPTTLTEFAPLSPEPEDNPGITYLISKFFKRGSGNQTSVDNKVPSVVVSGDEPIPPEVPLPSETRWPDHPEFKKESQSETSSLSGVGVLGVDVEEGRSLPNVLRRISNLLALKSSGLQSYKDTELKQYWMPDSVSKECYDCSEKFTTFRRKHHCRVCGQIFCSRCCNQEIPGKIMGCTGDLRVCTYCGKVVLSYLQSADMGADLSADLRALQQDLQTKFGALDTPLFPSVPTSQTNLSTQSSERDDQVKRKPSVGYQEEKFIQARQYSREEQSSPLHNLVNELSHPSSGLTARLGYSVFTGSQLVDWLVLQNRTTNRSQGVAIGQALLDTFYIESIGPETSEFVDSTTMFRLRESRSPSRTPPPPSSDELWPSEAPHECTTTDSESECPASDTNIPSSASLFRLDLNLEESTVHMSRPPPSAPPPSRRAKPTNGSSSDRDPVDTTGMVVKAVQSYKEASREPVNWYNAPAASLRTDNAERQAYLTLNGGFQQHLAVLVKQLLNSEGLAQSWSETVLPLAQTVVDTVRPDLRNDNDDMDIRQYVQLKKVSGGSRSDSCIVGGVVCRKNLAHRAMPTRLANPRILLLSCAIVYQRVEGRLMSLEPVMMQEQEYLRHTVARIAAMAPDLVLVQRNVSRLAQESLLRLGISLVLNVKSSVLERVARMTGADIVKSIDAQVCRPQLGKCANFYVKTFTSETGASKTLMFLEGCSSPHLGCTVLLRGAPTNELAKLKRVTSWLIYALYNWRLELSFLMDEFARPPSLKDDNFFHDNSNSSPSDENRLAPISPLNEKDFMPSSILSQFSQQKKSESESYQSSAKNSDTPNASNVDKENEDTSNKITNDLKMKSDFNKSVKLSGKEKSVSEDRRINVESVSDFSDPLHSYLNLEDEVFSENNNGQSLAVSEPLQSNRFRKALDDTLLSVSPFLKFSVPYLETESGRNCLLRRYFPTTVYWTAQLDDKPAAPARPAPGDASNKDALLKLNGVKLGPVHPFVTAKLTEPVSSDEVQTLLALYRAQGGRLPLTPHRTPPVPAGPPAPSPPPPVDSLDPGKHQRLAVLFCSYSHESPNAPSFCVNPWVVHMDYYGRNDISLGAFLERYCFRSSYVCPSDRCDTPMMKHVRRFVHDGGAVQISLREIEGAPHTDDESILMWTYCPACNQQVTQVMRMSNDTWAFSFAKYLELHFHAGLYTPRGGDCTHSLHQACRQFFGHKNMVAYFQYDKISVWEISLPPLLLVTQAVAPVVHQDAILEEVKRWALNGYEVFSAVLNRLCMLASNGEAGAMVMKQQLQKEQALFKSRVEEIQLRLTSPTHSSGPEKAPKLPNLWQLEDSLVMLKRSIAEAVCDWNTRLSEAEAAYHLRRREEKNKKSVQDKSSTSTGLGEIIDGVLTSQIVDVQTPDSPHLGRRPLGSQPSQTSLHSATDVMDVDDSHDTLAEDSDSIFIRDFDSEPTDNIRPNTIQINPVPSDNLVTVESKTSPLTDVVSESEEAHERKLIDHPTDDDAADTSVGPGSGSKESHTKHPLSDRVSVKQILSQLLPKDTPSNPLQCPMSPQEHYTLPVGVAVPVVVYEREPSSIIAYALSCQDYRAGLDEMRAKRTSGSEQPSPSPLLKRKSGSLESKETTTELSSIADSRKPGVLSFLRTTSSSGNLNQGTGGGVGMGEGPLEGEDGGNKPDSEPVKPRSSKDKPSSHLEVQFSDSTANFIVKVYYADEFARLRATIFPAGEDAFVRSLSRCIQWAARGGKSGSNFAKTKDDRFILKEMSRTETHPFMDSAPQYFDYIDRCVRSGSPTLLGKIVGVYRIMYRSTTSNATFRSNLLVMENLFYGRQVKHKFDLKGSVRNRLVNPMEQGGEIVLLDENLINMTCDSPLYILPHSKTVLMQAIQSDTQFLAGQSVMDYSLLVGLDETNKELVVGIIDYIRTFTWDKRLETMVKKSGLLGGQGKLPTIVSPDEYRDRFIAAMHRYFLPVPDQWTGLGKGLDF